MRALLVYAMGLALVACSPTEPRFNESPTKVTTQNVRNGEKSSGDLAVVALVGRSLLCEAGSSMAYCTGTLIAPSVVLTAAHCLERRRAADIRVVFGVDASAPSQVYDVDDAKVHPDFDAGKGRFDLALLHLARPATERPLPVRSKPLDDTLGDLPLRVVGFGLDEKDVIGIKRSGVSKLTTFGVGSESELFRYGPNPSMTCSGDSGGPVFATMDGAEELVGVTRSGDAACVELGTAVRTSAATDFIADYLMSSAMLKPRPLFDRGIDECKANCTSDEECPLSMLCLSERAAGRHCGLPGLQSGRFDETCTKNAECGEGACVSTGTTCQCFRPCTSKQPPVSPLNGSVQGGGCMVGDDTSADSSRSRGWIVLAFGIFLTTFRRRRAA